MALTEQQSSQDKPGISGGTVGNALDFAFFHSEIPNVKIETASYCTHKDETYFVLIYNISYPPKGIAKFPDGGTYRRELQKLYLFSRNNITKMYVNITEIKYAYLSYRNPSTINLAFGGEQIFIGAHFENPEGKFKWWDGILSYNLKNKAFTELIRNASLRSLSPDGNNIIFSRGDNLMIYNYNTKNEEILSGKIYGIKWVDNANFLTRLPGSDTIMSLNINDKKLVKTDIPIKNIKHASFFADGNEESIAEIKAMAAGFAFFEENGIPDPIPFIGGLHKDSRLVELAPEVSRHLRLAITAKFLRENKRDLLEKIISGLDEYGEKRINTGNNRIIAELIRKDIGIEKEIIKKISDNYMSPDKIK
ncbi:MAG: hypothetical protein JXN64_09100 [Spirochaetes bacterium]|nr:hypothetical protein [Spirochaetota bacterium]